MLFSGLASAKKQCFNDVSFNTLSYLSAIDVSDININDIDNSFLVNTEERFNLSFSESIHTERHFWHLNKLQKLYLAQEIARKIISDLDSLNISIVVSSGIADFASYITHKICPYYNIPFIYSITIRLGNYYCLSSTVDSAPIGFHKNLELNKQLLKHNPHIFNNTVTFIENYKINKTQPYYVNDKSSMFRYINWGDLNTIKKFFRNKLTDKNSYNNHLTIFQLFTNRLKRITNKRFYDNIVIKDNISLEDLNDKNYFIYPLHFHPESATLMLGRWFNDQVRIIEMISKALPANYILIVKEHPVSIGRRTNHFYKEISYFHNVFFISDKYTSHEILSGSKGVITISSTMGFEAFLHKKPCICIGDVFYNASSNTYSTTDFKNFNETIKKAINHIFDDDDLIAIFHTLLADSFLMEHFYPSDFSQKHVETFAQLLNNLLLGKINTNLP